MGGVRPVGERIVGREAELAAIGRFLRGIPESPAVLVVEGEPGIGKTTLWLEALHAAEVAGLEVLTARPAESEALLSYAALTDLVGDRLDELRGELPAVQERALAAALLRAEADRPAAARTIATAFLGVLAALAGRRPVLVAVDDVQWLDPASEGALAFAARRLPPGVGLLVTRRVTGPVELPLGLARALPEAGVERIVPGPLTLAGLHQLVLAQLRVSLPRPLLSRLADASGGNPLFALEIARTVVAGDGPHAAGEPLPIPHSLEELVAARVNGLSEPARQAALVAASLSQPTRATVLDALGDADDARAALLGAEEARVLVADGERLRFGHPLLASAVYGAAAPERRRAVHERLAAVVSDLELRARHLALSATDPEAGVAAELEDAARRAATRGAQQAAAELVEAAARLTPTVEADERARRLLGEAAARLALGDLGPAQELAEKATASPAVRARGLSLLGDVHWAAGSWVQASEAFEGALRAARDDAELAALVYPRYVYCAVAHRPASALERADAALAALDAERAPGAVASVAIDRFWAGLFRGESPRYELLERWRELEPQAGPEARRSTIPLIHFHCVDDFDSARARHTFEDEWYRARGEDEWRAERQAHRAFAELRAGEWELAERLVDESCAAIAGHPPGPWTMAFRFRSIVDAGRGRTARAHATLVPLVEEARGRGQLWWEALLLSALAVVEFADGEHRAVDETLVRMRECLDEIGTVDMVPDRSEPFRVESLVALGEVERAREVLARLEERGRVFPRLWIDVTLPRTRALVLAADGDVDGALAELDLTDPDKSAKLPLDHGWTLLVQGRLLRRARRRGAAAEALRSALAVFERLGAPAWEAQARNELERVGLRRSPQELTATELRVAELAASGLTNREVAAQAFMSPKTVEANLARVYRKLGIHSRAELGARRAAGAPEGVEGQT